MPEAERVPHFIIGGAPRSGTTFLCHLLDRHPGIYLAKPFIPEPKVFMRPELPGDGYLDRYRALFADAGEGMLLGEKTSYYLESESVCQCIHDTLPNVRMLFLVREPVDRAYSNYLWSRKNGIETLSFEEAVRLEGRRADPMPPEKSYARPFDYLSRGDYARLAANYYDRLGRERVRFFLYEDIGIRLGKLLEEIQEFLDIDATALEPVNPELVNSARETGPPLADDIRRELRERMLPSVRRFAELSGLDISPWCYDD